MGKRVLLFLVISFLLAGIVLAEENNTLNESFNIMSAGLPKDIIPPSIPDIEGYAKSSIGQPGNVLIEMRDVDSGERICNVHVNYEIIGDQESTSSMRYVGEEGFLELNLDPGNYNIILKIDELDTDGYDYYAREIIVVDQEFNESFNAFPVGSVRGTVTSRSGNLVIGAILNFECSKQYGDLSQQTTSNVGRFRSNALPVGMCVITASYNGAVGSEEIDIEKGDFVNVDVVLSSEVTGNFVLNWIFWLVIIILLVAIVTGYYIIRQNKGKKSDDEKKPKDKVKPAPGAEEEAKSDISKRSLDILKTLNAREREIVQFLLDCKAPCLQNKVVHNTGIPKTSIVRIFENLESKNIIKVKKVGKAKKIKLTPWFLEKE